MTRYIVRRLIIGFFLLWAVSVIAFGLTRVIPGDAIDALIARNVSGNQLVVLTEDLQAQFERLYGLNKPLHTQYLDWVGRIVRGDMGLSQRTTYPIAKEVARRVIPTLELTFAAMSVSLLIAIPLGVLTAVRKDTVFDFFGTVFSLIGVSIPNFLLGTVFVLAFAIWLPFQIQSGYFPFTESPLEHFKRLILPAVTLGASSAAILVRLTRSSLLEVLDQDYIRTARAKGLEERVAIWRHALRNALIPVLTVAGLQFGNLLGGSVIVETVFSWPGLGIYLIEAVGARDYPIIQILVLFMTSIFICVNLMVDILYAVVDPRIRYEQ